MKKKALALLCAAALTLGLTACGNPGGQSSNAGSPSGTNTVGSSAHTSGQNTDFPTKNINLIIPYSAGGDSEHVIRVADRKSVV